MKNISVKRLLIEFNDHLNKKTEANDFIGNKANKQRRADEFTKTTTKMKTHQKLLHQRYSTSTSRIKMNVQQ